MILIVINKIMSKQNKGEPQNWVSVQKSGKSVMKRIVSQPKKTLRKTVSQFKFEIKGKKIQPFCETSLVILYQKELKKWQS